MAHTSNDIWFIYLLQCTNGKIYTGITTDIEKRFHAHAAGKGAKFTKSNPPSHIIAYKKCKNRSDASKLEYAVKQLKPAQKKEMAAKWKAFLKDKKAFS